MRIGIGIIAFAASAASLFAQPAAIPTAVELNEAVRTAMLQASKMDDPRPAMEFICSATSLISPDLSVAVMAEADGLLRERRLSPDRSTLYASMAAYVSPQNLKVRDIYLEIAAAQGEVALRDETLWTAPPSTHPLRNPQLFRQKQRELLGYRVRLWRTILEARTDSDAARKALDVLLTDSSSGYYGTDAGDVYSVVIALEAANLDPSLLFRINPVANKSVNLPEVCYRAAWQRHRDGKKDEFTRMLITYSLTNGYTTLDSFRLYRAYDPLSAWKIANTLEDTQRYGGIRHGALTDILVDYAQTDPDRALALAETESDKDVRRALVQEVSLRRRFDESTWPTQAREAQYRLLRAINLMKSSATRPITP